MSAFKRGGWPLSGGHDHANRRKPERQLVGRNELDDGSGSGPTGRILAIPLVIGTTTDFRPKAAGGNSTCEVTDNASDPTHYHHQPIKSFVQAFLFPDR